MGAYKEALAAASDYRDIFGAENFFVEIMRHDLEVETRVFADLIKLAKELNGEVELDTPFIEGGAYGK